MSGTEHDDVVTGGPLAVGPAAIKEEVHLEGLADRFEEAMAARRANDADRAIDLLRGILRDEPRLAEPHLELAGLLLGLEQPEEALEHAREAVRLVSAGGVWTEAVPAKVIESLAWDTLGECLKQTADQDSVVFGPEDRWRALMEEAKFAFARAAELDPDNEHASWGAFGFGVELPRAEDGGARWVRRAPEQDDPEGDDEDVDFEDGDDDEDLAAALAGVLPDADLVELIRRQNAPPEPEPVDEEPDDDDPA